jgi:membrane AbrB-like protein
MIDFSPIPKHRRWLVLLLLTGLFSAFFFWMKLPAALLIGPMIAAIILETGNAQIRLPKSAFYLAQGIIACMVARTLTADILHALAHQWWLFLLIMLIIIAFNCMVGTVMSKMGLLPGTTAIWGLLPGAASAMMLMAEAYGADARLVAFMQYIRVVIVAVLASLIARFMVHSTAVPVPVIWFPPIHPWPFAETLAVIAIGVVLGLKSRLPGGVLLVPLFAATALNVGGIIEIELPRWFLALGYVFLGWQIGLRFTREVLAHAIRTLPQILIAIFLVIGFCAFLGWVLTHYIGIDMLSAYLATSPGGLDAVAIIAASTKVSVGFVMALQSARFLVVLFIGPVMSRVVANKVSKTP